MKVLLGMALWQTTWFVESLLRVIDLDWAVPNFGTLRRHQKGLKVNIPYRGSQGRLHLLSDSAGINVEGEGEWNARKCHDAIAARGAAVIIPPRKTATPWKPDTAGTIARDESLRASKRLGRTVWRPLSAASYGCSCRAMDAAAITAEAASEPRCPRRFSRTDGVHRLDLKLLGQRMAARDFDRQVAKFHIRVAVLNGFTVLGIPVKKVAG